GGRDAAWRPGGRGVQRVGASGTWSHGRCRGRGRQPPGSDRGRRLARLGSDGAPVPRRFPLVYSYTIRGTVSGKRFIGRATVNRTFSSSHHAKIWEQWTREDFSVSPSTPWNPTDETGGTDSLFASAARTTIERTGYSHC